jgi:uncharacterized protein YyaL (SSP411 family)
LEHAASSYLRSARHQPVAWQMWGEEAFAQARAEDKPILLDIGAVWCHWCHVMDRESYDDPEMARIINENFVAVKVDRDERPDVDARLQSAAATISGQGGWPLTAFLTPDGRPYFAGTYFPPDDRYGRPGLRRVLQRMAQVWRERREEALESASGVMAMIESNENLAQPGQKAALSLGLVDRIAGSILAQFDSIEGGFGSEPKFPHPAALDLLLQMAMSRDNEQARDAFALTLERMARGGVYDQLAGGFHRYSVDGHWQVPHFEKMLYDNTELLRNYVHGFQSLVRPDFLATAQEIVAWLDGTMTDRERGGFYASQDADIDLDDDGDYFTWTLDEAEEALDAGEFAFAARYWGIRRQGPMHHDPARNVLHLPHTLEELAAQTGQPLAEVRALLESARGKMHAARLLRPTPFIDRTLFTGWNALAVTAYLETARVLRMDAARDFALRTLRRLLAEAWDGEQTLQHVIAYGSSSGGQTQPQQTAPGTLEDYAFTVHACIDAWFSSGRMEFYHAAVKLAEAMIARFYDRSACAFNDTATPVGKTPLGALAAHRTPIQDTPTPAGNPVAAAALLRLETLSGRAEYHRIAADTLRSFAALDGRFGLYTGSYGLAVERLLLDPLQVMVVGSGPEAARLEALAVARYAVNKTVMRIAPFRLVPDGIPPALAEMLTHFSSPPGVEVWAIVCRGRTCLPLITEAEALLEALEG